MLPNMTHGNFGRPLHQGSSLGRKLRSLRGNHNGKGSQNEGPESAVTFKYWREALHSGEIEIRPVAYIEAQPNLDLLNGENYPCTSIESSSRSTIRVPKVRSQLPTKWQGVGEDAESLPTCSWSGAVRRERNSVRLSNKIC